ncbi:MAG: glutamate-1-semialdehyde 2,1-aminomutase [candidate division Zixibacteria bacterium]|nr:glutamate-1-semialdehyde 2,1-aminomutase [candidate division Zixibacteria bacterium]
MSNKKPNSKSSEIFTQSSKLIPGGVNSPVRAFKSVGGSPFIVDKGEGAWLYDVDGNRYVDYVMSWGPLILGHAHKQVVKAVKSKADSGTSFGAPTEDELTLALIVNERMPWAEKIRLVSSGTEACMTAARLARGAAGRDIIIKFDGGYHGHSDSFLIKAGSGLAAGGIPASNGIPDRITKATLSIPYNNIDAVESCFKEFNTQIAGVIVEPIAANMGVIPPVPGFLEKLRELTKRHGSVLIFDEVITGFRIAPGGAAEYYDIKPDLVCLGKILGGGMPIGAVGGKQEIMDNLAPLGAVYQAGTLSGNPLSTVAGIAVLKELSNINIYRQIKQYADDLTGKISKLCEQYDMPAKINQAESLFTLFFTDNDVIDFDTINKCDMNKYAKFFHSLLKQGVYIPPSGYEAWFVSYAHRKEHLDLTIKAIEGFLNEQK